MTWHNINEEDGASLNFLAPFIDVYEKYVPPRYGIRAQVAMELKGEHVRYFLHDSFLSQLGKLHRDVCQPESFLGLERKVESGSEELHALSADVLALDLKSATHQVLCKKAAALSEKLCDLIGWGLVPALIDVGGEHITAAATKAIEKNVVSKKLKRPVAEYFATLTTPAEMTTTREEEISAIGLAIEYRRKNVKTGKDFKAFQKAQPAAFLKTLAHAERFAWTYFGYCGPSLTPEKTFEKALALSTQTDLEQQRENLTQSVDELKTRQAGYERELGMTEEQAWAVLVAKESMRLKTVRKDAMVHAAYALDFLMREIARRTHTPLSSLRCAKVEELPDVFSGKLDETRLSDRHRCVVYRSTQKGPVLLEGKEAEKFCKKEFREDHVGEVSELKGQCAHPGRGKGTVRIIDKAEQMYKMNPGDILVSIATTPEIVPVMKQAAAIVTEIGGITSHAAIVSRELKIPCLIGTKVATRVFRDGDQVEVDATEGWVRKI